MKKLMTIGFVLLLLFGCSEKTAEKHGEGISIEFGVVGNIHYVGINLYVDELIFSRESTYKEEEGSFQPGEIIWFHGPVIQSNHIQEVEVVYSSNKDGSDAKTTNMIDITEAKEWVNTKLNHELELELLTFK
ncbi:hypothetical protein M3212_06410 [Alkalihalobacillus oceani]|uniref:hypothetical protein n=1 Tax=Halalkalibacter oceani TaxID=1653776 RepID=UPI002040538C|nr:hypothetical protein [Halalkalibacter oceani]MCM3760422.1 hypothetical protein [Halalkalibacter oceani]